MPDVRTKLAEGEVWPPIFVRVIDIPPTLWRWMTAFAILILGGLAWIGVECHRSVNAVNALSGIVQTATEATWQAQSRESRPPSPPTRER